MYGGTGEWQWLLVAVAHAVGKSGSGRLQWCENERQTIRIERDIDAKRQVRKRKNKCQFFSKSGCMAARGSGSGCW
jgi:hypothetical protein